jgi:flagellar biosynthetic protein FliR
MGSAVQAEIGDGQLIGFLKTEFFLCLCEAQLFYKYRRCGATMLFDADIHFVTALILVFTRLCALFLLTPLFAVTQVPVHIRIIFLLALAGLLTASMKIVPASIPHSPAMLVEAGICEFFIGALMAFGLFAAFGAFLFGGRILDLQMGFGVANLINPSTNTQGPLLGTILNLAGVMTFFLLDGHHMLIRGFAYSIEQLPVGQGIASIQIEAVIAQFGKMFVYGLMLVAPAVFAMFLLDMGLAVAARTMPQINIFILGFPLKIFVGSILLVFSLKYLSPLLKRIFESIFRCWEHILI